jgi:uncharacterized protein YdhG (YjbR/CyaY superfamily)
MATESGDRAKHFPAIEKKYGQPIKHWLTELASLDDQKYPAQISYLRENHGFSQTHANAVVMFAKGSVSSKRHKDPADYFKKLDKKCAKTTTEIFKVIQAKYPELELVIAWNQPMLKAANGYVFGLGVQKNHILLNPFSTAAIEKTLPKLKDYKVNKHTIQVPFDWQIEKSLLLAFTKIRLAELARSRP